MAFIDGPSQAYNIDFITIYRLSGRPRVVYDEAMNAEVIAIGTELLLGFVVNTDTAYLGRVLAGLGIDCYHQVTVGDNPARLAETIRAALGRADLVITCGGLGPTVDDVTLETISQATGRPLRLDRKLLKTIEGRFARNGIKMPPSNRRQALVPEGGFPLHNPFGTAPGIFLPLRGTAIPPRTQWLVALPGPPPELMPMVENRLIPRLKRLGIVGGSVLISRTLKLTGAGESEIDAKVRDILAMKGAVTVGIYAHPGQVDLRITARGKNGPEVERRIASVERKLRARFGAMVFAADDETMESEIGRLLKKRRRTLATAESCTGGGIAERVTRVPGSSDYFLGGVVSYANTLKESALGVPRETLKLHGAVSSQTARAMAEGVKRLTGSDYALSVTGIAGPSGGSRNKPVGLVYLGLSGPKGTKVSRFLFSGGRAAVQSKAAQAALNLLRLELLGR